MTGSDFDYVFAEVGPTIRQDLEVEDIPACQRQDENGVSFSPILLVPAGRKAEVPDQVGKYSKRMEGMCAA